MCGREVVRKPPERAIQRKILAVKMVMESASSNPNKELETSLNLTFISLTEENPPESVEPIEWLLMTNCVLNQPLTQHLRQNITNSVGKLNDFILSSKAAVRLKKYNSAALTV